MHFQNTKYKTTYIRPHLLFCVFILYIFRLAIVLLTIRKALAGAIGTRQYAPASFYLNIHHITGFCCITIHYSLTITQQYRRSMERLLHFQKSIQFQFSANSFASISYKLKNELSVPHPAVCRSHY